MNNLGPSRQLFGDVVGAIRNAALVLQVGALARLDP
jgi:hypothetical protein